MKKNTYKNPMKKLIILFFIFFSIPPPFFCNEHFKITIVVCFFSQLDCKFLGDRDTYTS